MVSKGYEELFVLAPCGISFARSLYSRNILYIDAQCKYISLTHALFLCKHIYLIIYYPRQKNNRTS